MAILREVLPFRVQEWPESAKAYWAEKAGHIEFDAGPISREEAEREAERIVRQWWLAGGR